MSAMPPFLITAAVNSASHAFRDAASRDALIWVAKHWDEFGITQKRKIAPIVRSVFSSYNYWLEFREKHGEAAGFNKMNEPWVRELWEPLLVLVIRDVPTKAEALAGAAKGAA